MDLWLSRVALRTALDAFAELDGFSAAEPAIVGPIADTFDSYPFERPVSVASLVTRLDNIQSELDLRVNNAALTRSLGDIVVRATRGKLPFSVGRAFGTALPTLSNLTWLYLIDELENLTPSQQRYVQTLIREKESPSSIIAGARSYGFRTRETYSAGEENKEGSEYAVLELDQHYIEHSSQFRQFCRNLVARRLIRAGYATGTLQDIAERLDSYFDTYNGTPPFRDAEVAFVSERSSRPYLVRLAKQLEHYASLSHTETQRILESIRLESHPLLERFNVFLLYQAWARGHSLLERATEIQSESYRFATGEPEQVKAYSDSLKHHRADILATLIQEYGLKQRYLGVDTFVQMAAGLPRNMLVVLKNIWRWAEFNGEAPFVGNPITEVSQRAGVLQASDWFLRDSLALGAEGQRVETAVVRVANLLRALRFSDKPPEVSLATVSIDEARLSPTARATLTAATQWSLLIRVRGGQRNKNTGALDGKYQLNPMLSPRWDLPVVRRGALDLAPHEAEALLGDEGVQSFEQVRKVRMARATVPFRTAPGGEFQASLLEPG
jgi:hypothetical protein